jgi:hypothetical protein
MDAISQPREVSKCRSMSQAIIQRGPARRAAFDDSSSVEMAVLKESHGGFPASRGSFLLRIQRFH